MYICMCDDVKFSEIGDVISSGLKYPEEILEKMNVATGCGACRENLFGIVQDLIDKRA